MNTAGRFAPSPSADLHLGNLRTALLAWLAARARDAPFRLRIDDLDAARSRREFAQRQLADLAALELAHDGEIPHQSARTPRYAAAFEQLRAAGHLYPCFCTRAELRAAASAPHGAPTAGYPGTCRTLTAAECATRTRQLRDAGREPAWRFASSRSAVIFNDQICGPQSLAADDVVVRRADGGFGYQLAVVVDDADQGVGEVVRGADLLDSTPTQLELHARLELAPPQYAHVPLLLGPDGRRLAKRDGAPSLGDLHAGRHTLTLPGLPNGAAADPIAVRSVLAASVGLADPLERPTLAE
ncbi:MAG: tRNA glutamyl-Q(34) synthetase GluQRS, partial [Patulibacter sp.]